MAGEDKGSFKGTAYFRNVADLKFGNLGDAKISFVEKQSSRILEIRMVDNEEEKPKEPPVKISVEEITKEMEEGRRQYAEKMRPMLVLVLQNMKEDLLFHLPGTIHEGSSLKAAENGAIRFVFEGAKVIEAMTKALGIVTSVPVLPAPQGAGFKELKVGGVRLVTFSDQESGIRPFNYDAGYTLSV